MMADVIKKQRIFVGSPRASRCVRYNDFESSRTGLLKALSANGFDLVWGDEMGAIIPNNRNRLVKKAIEHECRWVLQIDDDMIFKPTAAMQLMSHGKDIISGLCVRRVAPYFPAVYNKDESGKHQTIKSGWPRKGLLEVDAVGGAFLLVDTNVFKRVEFPWFAMPEYPKNETGIIGEDMYFCKKAKEAGFKIFVDCDLDIGHLGDYGYTIHDWIIAKERLPKEITGVE